MTESLAASAAVPRPISDALRNVVLFIPKFVAFLAILVIGWLVARLLLKVVDTVLERIGFDRWVERGGIKAALARSRYDASDIVAKLVYYAVLLFTLQLAFGVWGPNPVSALIGGIVAWLPRAFVAVIIVVVASAIAGAVRDLITGALGGLSYGRALANVASWFIIAIGVIAALNQIGVATTVTTPILVAVLATIAGILIVGVGGGLVRPMQNRLERWLDRVSAESATISEHARAYSAGQRAAAERYAAERPAGEPVAGEPHPAEPARAGARPAYRPGTSTPGGPTPPTPGTSRAGGPAPGPGGLGREPGTGDDATRSGPATNPRARDDRAP
ncbi:mechanosensitive ion channel family protein [Planosporangium mesophilum]|uniref:Uncharacterized protein n=1 Tax=Planosporangium mesophilum TaxID=689768 RepID=A0A8J3TKC1_9ACTN|nr:hypothetical protein [Planosporangium mesophilum]NJC82433.1 hypothetical protein [Planosporangium mesophilum]GII26189.1 hypothetical protein Pme01_57860 [Planosporangium mesophilum]